MRMDEFSLRKVDDASIAVEEDVMHTKSRSMTIGMLSTFPPTQCGLATFAAALTKALIRQGHQIKAVRVSDEEEPIVDESVPLAAVLINGSVASVRQTVSVLSACDITMIQHEFGIFGGPDGEDVLQVMRALDGPIITVLHTIPQQASGHQADILIEVCDRSDIVVVMSESARDRLVYTYYPIEQSKVVTIAHGAQLAEHVITGDSPRPGVRPRFLTWGLIGPGKGIEHVIGAMGMLNQLGMHLRYTVSGSTHPKVLAREGTRYRDSLIARARVLGVEHLLAFDETYREVNDLTEYIASFDAVILPYDTYEQVTSGVLVDSLAAGRAVIATQFPHAEEMLGYGTGLLVPQKDARSIAVAMHTLASEPAELLRLQARAREVAPGLSWDTVAGQYAETMSQLLARREPTVA